MKEKDLPAPAVARRAGRTLAAALIAATSVIVPTAPAHAYDTGDGSVACNSGEICFRYVSNSDAYVKQFWYGANHSSQEGCSLCHRAYTFASWTGSDTGYPVMDQAEHWRNRDTSCTVYLFDVDGSGSWYVRASAPKASSTWYLITVWNNGHNRCTTTSPRTL